MDVPQIRHTYNRLASKYDLFEKPFELFIIRSLRRKLLSQARGRVLEIAIGTGANLPHYPPDMEVVGIDVSEGMLQQAQRKKLKRNPTVSLAQMDSQFLALADNIFDTVVCSMALCTVPNPVESLKQMTRVLRPGGKILLLEHIRSSSRLIAWIQEKTSPRQEKRMGCSFIRRTPEAVNEAGLVTESLARSWFGVMVSIVARPE